MTALACLAGLVGGFLLGGLAAMLWIARGWRSWR